MRPAQYFWPFWGAVLDRDFDNLEDYNKIIDRLACGGTLITDPLAAVSVLSNPSQCWTDTQPIHINDYKLQTQQQSCYEADQRKRQERRERVAQMEWTQTENNADLAVDVAKYDVKLYKPIDKYSREGLINEIELAKQFLTGY